MKIILLIMFWSASVTIPAMIITLEALREGTRHTEDPERSSYGKDI